MNNKDDGSPNNISENIKYHDTSDLQPRHANSGSSESDLVSDKIKEGVIYIIIVFTITITYNTSLNYSVTI